MTDLNAFETLAPVLTGPRLDIHFNRPDRRNALTHQMMVELTRLLRWTAANAAVRVVVLRGKGGNFSAGGDLDAMHGLAPKNPDGTDPLVPAYREMGHALSLLDALPQAVVAAVEGAAVGGGLGMACCADHVVARTDAKFGMPEAKWGFIPSQILPFVITRIGPGPARAMVATGSIARGEEAFRLGIAHELADDTADLEARLERAVADALLSAPHALATAKSLIRLAPTRSRDETLQHAAEDLVRLLREPEAEEGIKAFLAKRRPSWAPDQG
ncbi:MAG: enoyl-CoA hydratase/isomerase family protein [Alphaproteobacteria bacterium]|nr:enoyl-CoA hydratase/isomerase family protein [Alphaproteobacteria bacterium]MCB9927843.1 enoyl-CoA hydratase/isomerase family protein [Alphaproteobacteria bacterium]